MPAQPATNTATTTQPSSIIAPSSSSMPMTSTSSINDRNKHTKTTATLSPPPSPPVEEMKVDTTAAAAQNGQKSPAAKKKRHPSFQLDRFFRSLANPLAADESPNGPFSPLSSPSSPLGALSDGMASPTDQKGTSGTATTDVAVVNSSTGGGNNAGGSRGAQWFGQLSQRISSPSLSFKEEQEEEGNVSPMPQSPLSSHSSLSNTPNGGVSGGLSGGGGVVGGRNGGAAESSEIANINAQADAQGRRVIFVPIANDPHSVSRQVAWLLESGILKPEADLVVLAHVRAPYHKESFYGPEILTDYSDVMQTSDETKRQHARALVATTAQFLKKHNIAVRAIIVQGESAHTIVRKAQELSASLVILGDNKGEGVFKRAIHGSTTDFCTHHLKCTIVIAK